MTEDESCLNVFVGGWVQDSLGWTVLPQPTARQIFVSQANLAQQENLTFRVKTLSEGVVLLRPGQPDQLYLKRGETFAGLDATKLGGGPSRALSMVITAYGVGPRPVIKATTGINFGGAGVKNLIVTGLDFQGDQKGYGLWSGTNVDVSDPKFYNVLFEDCRWQNFVTGASLQSQVHGSKFYLNVAFRRSQFLDSYGTTGGHPQGIYADGVYGLTMEDNLLDANGYYGDRQDANQFNHNAYIMSTNRCVRFSGNVSTRASATGIQMRAGGVVEDNFFARNPMQVTWGLVNGGSIDTKAIPPGLTGRIARNTFLESTDIKGGVGWGRGNHLTLGNVKNLLVSDNVASGYVPNPAADKPGINRSALSIEATMGVGVHNLVFKNFAISDLGMDVKSAVKRSGSGTGSVIVQLDGSVKSLKGDMLISEANSGIPVQTKLLTIMDSGIDLAGASYLGQWPRSLAMYLGKPGIDSNQAMGEFLTKVRSMDRSNWDPKYSGKRISSYFRNGQ